MQDLQPSEPALARLLDALGDAPLSGTARAVLQSRYLRRNRRREVCETPSELFERVARHVCEAEPPQAREEARQMFSALMRAGLFLPNSPTLMNAGLPRGQLAACFVLPVEDSIEEIFEAVKSMALVQKTGGGTGFSFGRLRPRGDPVSTTGGTASGPVAFLEVFDAASESIRQGGRRRGASMGVLEVHHPDILEFIGAKANRRRLTNFNLSVGLTEELMAALGAGGSLALRYPSHGETRSELEASRVFRLLARSAWQTGEPGVLFLDRMEADNPTPELGLLETTNPCGELPLLPYESCNLGSVNLARFASGGSVDWPALASAVRWGVRMLDDVIDTTSFPLPKIAEATARTRKIGLGVMGFADLLIHLHIPYDSPRALDVAQEVMSFVRRASREASEELARRRGPFPAYEGSRSAARGEPPRRNATTNTVAPTGTISILAGCSPGIEPIFAPVLRRRMLDGQQAVEVHPLLAKELERLARKPGLDPKELLGRMAEAGHARVEGVPEELARLFVTAHQVKPSHHVKVQAAFHRHTDNSVSKTVNLPASSSPEDVEEIFCLAHELGCKGITVYRDASREDQVLSRATQQAPGGAGPQTDVSCQCCHA